MVRQGRQLRIFLASPSDVDDERSRVKHVVSGLNRTLGESEGVHLDLVRWETHAWPGFGADAQAVINREIEPGDIFVGILWRRIGTPTHRAMSGTVEEFERAYELWVETGRPTMLWYFNTTPFYPTREDLEQFRSVLDFKERLGEKGALFWLYNNPGKFEDDVRTHLYKEVQAQLRVPSGGRGEDPSRNLVLGVLVSSRNVGQGYRTLAGLARATGLSEPEVERVIDGHPDLIMKSRRPDPKGAALFKLRG
jgi:hypothetical protein